MATIHDLLKRVADDGLRADLEKEVRRLTSQKKFGLVFEEHLPERTPLYGMKIRRGMNVTKRSDSKISETYHVLEVKGDRLVCLKRDDSGEKVEFEAKDMMAVAEFGEPIYPVLQPVDKIEHGGGDLWHALIQADNYHALQLLEYLYPGQVDCIYIDPPYNTGARDWKYNNDYVDKEDGWRHSKWLSMMKKRLIVAKRLLNPKDSVLIVTIDEKEYIHLGMLLEELFPEATIQMISSVINPSGSKRLNEFSRCDEYVFFVMLGNAVPCAIKTNSSIEKVGITWETFRRHDLQSKRGSTKGGTAQFYPIYVDRSSGKIVRIGDPISPEVAISSVADEPQCVTVWPIRDNGIEMNWGARPETARILLSKGYLKAGEYKKDAPQKYVIKYLTSGTIDDIKSGEAIVDGYDSTGAVIAHYEDGKCVMPKTNWHEKSHNANAYGSKIVNEIVGARFSFPKSIYAVHDAIRYFVENKPRSLIVDFFAGSGTTLHAVNLLNAEDGGCRRCILVTNNEVSESEEKSFRNRGLQPGDPEWERSGIAQYVTWPRTKCSILGCNVDGVPLEDNYGVEEDDYQLEKDVLVLSSKTNKPQKRNIYKKIARQKYPILATMKKANGFAANCEFFKLGFVNKDAVSLGRQFKEILPLLWMRAGAKGARPELKKNAPEPTMMVLPQNGMAILLKEYAFPQFVKDVADDPAIKYVYLVTDSEKNFRDMVRSFEDKDCVQIYRDYLDNFRINKFGKR